MSLGVGLRSNVVSTMVANAAVMGMAVVFGSLSARLLGVDGRGELAAILLVPQLVFVISVLGVHEAVVFHIARRRFTIEAVFGAALVVTVPLALLGTVSSVFLTPRVLSHYEPHIRLASQVYAVSIPIGLLQGVMMRVLQGTKRFNTWNLFRVLTQLTSLIVLLILWWTQSLTPAAFALAILPFYGAMLVALAVLFYVNGLLRVRTGIEPVRAVCDYSWRAGVGTVPQIANFRVDQVIIAMFLSTHALGLYTTAVSWSTGFLPLASAYGSVVFPDVAAAARATESFARAMRRGLAVLVAGWLVYFALTPLLFRVIYGPEFTSAMPAALILGVASLFLSANQMLNQGIKGLGQPMLVSVSEVTGLVVTAILLIVLIPSFGIVGAALASLGAYVLTSAVLLVGLNMSACPWRQLLMIRRDEWKELISEVRASLPRLWPSSRSSFKQTPESLSTDRAAGRM